jgi:hypothetical protein
MKTKSKISGHILRGSAVALFFLFVIVALSSAINVAKYPPKVPVSQNNTAFAVNGHKEAPAIRGERTLTLADRVAYQRAIEEVYWQHRIWPKPNAGPKPPLDEVMSQADIQRKVADYLRDSQLLEQHWQKRITPDQLQAEMDRMAQHTKQPEVLREIFAALGNDPFVIAECLARATLSQRLIRDLYAHDERFHGELKGRAESDLAAHGSVAEMNKTSGAYSEVEWVKANDVDPSAGEKIAGQAHPLPPKHRQAKRFRYNRRRMRVTQLD